MDAKRLVMMANQIGSFFETQPKDTVTDIAAHIEMFWDPRMRAAIFEHLDRGGEGLKAPVREALETLRAKAPVRSKERNGAARPPLPTPP
ncbi:MAG TPA: formate dehydrogenase subunit delta [Hyphomicrobium sp.]|nr:formate dehydrogenase subunit delta [Hyphomicrobium sp.]